MNYLTIHIYCTNSLKVKYKNTFSFQIISFIRLSSLLNLFTYMRVYCKLKYPTKEIAITKLQSESHKNNFPIRLSFSAINTSSFYCSNQSFYRRVQAIQRALS